MEEARTTYCFCGCGQRVNNPRLVVTNTNGWDLADELAQWAKLEIFAEHTELDLAGGDIADNLERGRALWWNLRESIHSGEHADTDDEKTAVVWRRHAKKARRKLRRGWRGDVPIDPFEMPDLSAEELSAWITDGQEPAWAAEAGEDSEDSSSEDSSRYTSTEAVLLKDAAEALWHDTTWEWAEIPAFAVSQTADKLSNFREEYNLVLDCLGLGFWLRDSERRLHDGFNTFDPAYADHVVKLFADADDQPAILKAVMNEVRESMPGPFALGPEAWSETVDLATELLTARQRVFLDEHPEFDPDADISDEMREFTLGLGYGLGMALEALELEGTQPRQP